MKITCLLAWMLVPAFAAGPVAIAADSAAAKPAAVKPAAAKPDPANAAECDTAAKAWFAKAYYGGTRKLSSGRTVKASYVAHFSAKRKQCFVRLEHGAEAQGKAPEVATIALYEGDPANKKSLGAVVRSGGKVVHCDFEKQPCKTVEEWQAKTAPRMKE